MSGLDIFSEERVVKGKIDSILKSLKKDLQRFLLSGEIIESEKQYLYDKAEEKLLTIETIFKLEKIEDDFMELYHIIEYKEYILHCLK